jgi:hypothetical protein
VHSTENFTVSAWGGLGTPHPNYYVPHVVSLEGAVKLRTGSRAEDEQLIVRQATLTILDFPGSGWGPGDGWGLKPGVPREANRTLEAFSL